MEAVDPNNTIIQRQGQIASAAIQKEQQAPIPQTKPQPNSPLTSLSSYIGTETPMMQLNSSDIFPGMNEPTIIGETKVGGTNIHTFASGQNYFPFNIAQERKRALNNAAILRYKQQKQSQRELNFKPDKTPAVYEEQYNNMFHDQIQNLYKDKVAKYGGNAVAAYDSMLDSASDDYGDLHHRLDNLNSVADNLSYVYDFAQKIAGTKERSPLAKYYPPEAKQLATDLLEGRVKKEDWTKQGWAEDKLSELHGYDNLVKALVSPEITPLIQTNVDKLLRESMVKDETGKFRLNEEKVKGYKAPQETIDRIINTMDASGYTFSDKQVAQMPKLIENYMRARVKETDVEKYIAPNQWQGTKGFDDKKMWYSMAPPRQVAGGYNSTAPSVAFGQKGVSNLPDNTFKKTANEEVTGKPVDVVNFGTVEEPNLFLELQVPTKALSASEALAKYPKKDDRDKYYRELKGKPKSELIPLSGDAGEENRKKFSGEYSIQDINDWYKDNVKGYKGAAAPAAAAPKSTPSTPANEIRSKYSY